MLGLEQELQFADANLLLSKEVRQSIQKSNLFLHNDKIISVISRPMIKVRRKGQCRLL